jgi:hypothetical protein
VEHFPLLLRRIPSKRRFFIPFSTADHVSNLRESVLATYIPCIAEVSIFQITSLSVADRPEARTTSTCKLIEFICPCVNLRLQIGGGEGEWTYSPFEWWISRRSSGKIEAASCSGEAPTLEESRARLSAFMVRYLRAKGPPRFFKSFHFADVMRSINGHDLLPATECQIEFVCMMVTWLQFPSNINVRYT